MSDPLTAAAMIGGQLYSSNRERKATNEARAAEGRALQEAREEDKRMREESLGRAAAEAERRDRLLSRPDSRSSNIMSRRPPGSRSSEILSTLG